MVIIPPLMIMFYGTLPFIELLDFQNLILLEGYDPSSNDFNLVRLVYLKRHYNEAQPLVEIYTLNSGCWRTIASPPQSYIVKNNRLSTFVNEASHWLAHTPPNAAAGTTFRNVILAFDMGKEVFHEIEVPSCFVGESHSNMAVGVPDGLLCLVPRNSHPCGKLHFSVWIMKDYGIGESWSKLFDIDISQGLLTVVAFRKNGEVLITVEDGELHSYKPNTQQVTSGIPWIFIREHGDILWREGLFSWRHTLRASFY
ncbi:hypothetical protein I3842_03G173900 [Carya illinoinensis]|uniref:F-box associated beta-propeller type 1 domain-containing protein n=1 Tax=Carya illinoinensis TaxID=32201 RepID=A0A922JWC4_CARIL|nr:hypothetical protein I3842_03G173900 [Carya illinoinensis]